ncbi:fibronectin type III domain-containing protein [Herbaspirillum huttiense]|uniref:fibronectin type III domain-containing protein n=1 Tax=Herbaspirillum huttiense TaxID=863372 RepID=UPI003F3CA3F8
MSFPAKASSLMLDVIDNGSSVLAVIPKGLIYTTLQWSRVDGNGVSTDIAGAAGNANPYIKTTADRGYDLSARATGVSIGSRKTLRIPAVAPGAPTNVVASPGNGSVTGAFTAPADNGGSAITGYQMKAYRASDNAYLGSANGSTSPLTLSGLANGVAVYVTVAAVNAIGVGMPSAVSSSVTPKLAIASQNIPNHALLTVGGNKGITTGCMQQEASGQVVAVRLCIATKTLSSQVLPQFKAVVATSDTAGGNNVNDTWQPNVNGTAYPALADGQGRGWVPVTFNGGQPNIVMPAATGDSANTANAVIRSDRIALPSRPRKSGETGGPMFLARIEQMLGTGQWAYVAGSYNPYVAALGQAGMKVWRSSRVDNSGVSNLALNPPDLNSWYMLPFWFEFEYAQPHIALIVSGDSRYSGGGHPVIDGLSWAVQPLQAAQLRLPIDICTLGASGFSSSQYMKLVTDYLSAGGSGTHVLVPVHTPNDGITTSTQGDAALARVDSFINTMTAAGIKTILSTGYACGYNGTAEQQRQRMIQWAKDQATAGRVILFDNDPIISDTTTTPGTGVISASYFYSGDNIHCNGAGNTAMGNALATLFQGL